MAVHLSKKPLKERFPEVLKTPRESLPVHYKIEKDGYEYVPYKKEGDKWKNFLYVGPHGWNEIIKFSTFDKAKNYIKDACTYFSVTGNHELIETNEEGHIIIDD
jgi:hypothetical protein